MIVIVLGREGDLPGSPLHQGRDVRPHAAGHSDQRQGGVVTKILNILFEFLI